MALHNGRLYHTEDEIEHINGIGKRQIGRASCRERVEDRV